MFEAALRKWRSASTCHSPHTEQVARVCGKRRATWERVRPTVLLWLQWLLLLLLLWSHALKAKEPLASCPLVVAIVTSGVVSIKTPKGRQH